MTTLLALMALASRAPEVALPSTIAASVESRVQGTLDAKVVIVEDLVQFPVAYSDFEVIGPEPTTVQSVRTNADGKLSLHLDPGLYAITSRSPISFKGRSYTWSTSFEINNNRTTTLTLTHTDAMVEHPKVEPKRDVSTPETKLFNRFQNSVGTVECDWGSGSAFVFDADRGLLLTTYEVAGKSNFLSVRFSRGHHYEARLVAGDPSADLAVIRVHPDALRGIPSIPLKTSRRIGVEGERVAAMGSPIFQQTTITQGILSKVEEDSFVSDVQIGPGNAGGPILNLEGEAIGVAAFGNAKKPGDEGATGIISIRKSDRLIKSIGILTNQTLPPATKLPDNSPVLIPPDMLERVSRTIKGGEPFYKAPKNFRTYVKTPFDAYSNVTRYKDFLRSKIARRYKGKVPADQDLEMGPLYFWNKYVGNQFEPVVTIEVVPWPQETTDSLLGRVASLASGQKLRERYEMRDDFTKMVLYRNGIEVTPIVRKRIRDIEIYDTVDMYMHDTALAGLYTYDPNVFTPGSKLELKIWKNAEKRPTVVRIEADMQNRIWNQFRDWAHLGG